MGRDFFYCFFRLEMSSFNSRARVGRDLAPSETFPFSIVFQLTRPRGARRMLVLEGLGKTEFQLTRPRGARLPRQ